MHTKSYSTIMLVLFGIKKDWSNSVSSDVFVVLVVYFHHTNGLWNVSMNQAILMKLLSLLKETVVVNLEHIRIIFNPGEEFKI
jgi:hypothetical protein